MRRVAVVLVAMTIAVAAVSCTSDSGSDGAADEEGAAPTLPLKESMGLLPQEGWEGRQDEYLAFATEGELDTGRPLSVIAEAEAAKRSGREPELDGVTVEAFQPIFDKIESFTDTSDFDINELITLWLRDRDVLDQDLAKEIEKQILAFKYWWTEPTPEGQIDDQYYWTENHQIIYLADEYVAGQTFPNRTFTNDGKTGKAHMAHAEERLQKWFTLRARFGFSEWLSNVYWTEDFKGLLLLAEFADDATLARQASMMLDVLFVELAGHIQQGTFGSTHGRTYQKDKLEGPDEDTFSIAKMTFDQTPVDYVNADNATLLGVATRYRPPEVARQIAADRDTGVFRTRQGIPLDPRAPVDADAKAPYGLPWDGEDGLMTWWGMGGQFPWQVAPLSVDTVKEYDLFKTSNFKQAADLEPVVADADDDTVRNLAHELAIQVNPGLLSEVDTYTWRSRDVMLSTAQDWRPGQRGEQDHISQATFGPEALVFAQHPREGSNKDDEPGNGGSFTGDGAMPRAAQHENVAISIYAPQYEGGGGIGSGAYSFTYEPYTHAYFPTEKFDEVVQEAGWTLARKDDGFIGLWSQRPTTWKDHTGEETTVELTEDYDLVAEGGADNVWITEVAQAADYADAGDGTEERFDAFVAAVTGATVSVTPADCATDGQPKDPGAVSGGPKCVHNPAAGALVTYDSPSQGEMTFGWDPLDSSGTSTPYGPDTPSSVPSGPKQPSPSEIGLLPLTVKGQTIDIHPDGIRWDSPWADAKWDTQQFHASAGGATLDLDFKKKTRRTTR